MEEPKKEAVGLNGFSHVSSSPSFWKSRKRAVRVKNSEMPMDDHNGQKEQETQEESTPEVMQEDTTPVVLSEKRKALFEPLEPMPSINGRRNSTELLLPPPDFDSAIYPKGWLIGKKRKLVNVDVVESMRRIAVQEMNRKDREIGGLNEQLEEDAKCLEHLQIQLLEERSKRSDVERQNAMLQSQVNMLMEMLQENENIDVDDDGGAQEP